MATRLPRRARPLRRGGASTYDGARNDTAAGKTRTVKSLLALSRAIDTLNERVGRGAYWLILACVLVSAANAFARYGLSLSSNAFLEIQWYLYSMVFLGAAGYTLKHNAHVRIDLVAARLSPRAQAWIDIFGAVFMLLPVCTIILWFGWSAFLESWRISEVSNNAGGLPLWPIKLVVPLAFALLILQGVSETIKRIAFLRGIAKVPPPAGGQGRVDVPHTAERR
jgi:TRAP-type mannitol/chloroaromatic compound transport system permease small subunit